MSIWSAKWVTLKDITKAVGNPVELLLFTGV
jgi:hypothetical protein